MKREPCILFQWIVTDPDTSALGTLIEQLRYAGIISIIKQTEELHRTFYMLELRAPKGVDQRVWADQNSLRMQSFGINAQASWREL